MERFTEHFTLLHFNYKIYTYGGTTSLVVLGTFTTHVESKTRITLATIYIIQGTHGCLLSYKTATELQLISIIAHTTVLLSTPKSTQPSSAVPTHFNTAYSDRFQLLFNRDKRLKPASSNCKSDNEHLDIIKDYLAKEIQLGRVAGPFASPLDSIIFRSAVLVLYLKNLAYWRLILNLSHPPGFSVNDGIDPETSRTQHCKFDDAIRMIVDAGAGTLMAKMDIKSAYRIIPVHPQDRYLLGMKWGNYFYVDLALPFGLRSVAFIFNSVADMLAWILQQNYAVERLLHYLVLDDYTLQQVYLSRTYMRKELASCGYSSPSVVNWVSHAWYCLVFLTCLVFLIFKQTARLPGKSFY